MWTMLFCLSHVWKILLIYFFILINDTCLPLPFVTWPFNLIILYSRWMLSPCLEQPICDRGWEEKHFTLLCFCFCWKILTNIHCLGLTWMSTKYPVYIFTRSAFCLSFHCREVRRVAFVNLSGFDAQWLFVSVHNRWFAFVSGGEVVKSI